MPTRAELRVSLERLSTPELLATLSPVLSSSYTSDALAVVRELLAERGVDPKSAQVPACPGCGHVLDVEQGELGPGTGLILEFGYQPASFKSTASGRSEIVLHPGLSKPAVRCRRCGLVMFGGRL